MNTYSPWSPLSYTWTDTPNGRTVTETFEYDEDGRLVKKTITTIEHVRPRTAPTVRFGGYL